MSVWLRAGDAAWRVVRGVVTRRPGYNVRQPGDLSTPGGIPDARILFAIQNQDWTRDGHLVHSEEEGDVFFS